MARKDEDLRQGSALLALFALLPFALAAPFFYFWLRKEHQITDNNYRIFDWRRLSNVLLGAGGLLFTLFIVFIGLTGGASRASSLAWAIFGGAIVAIGIFGARVLATHLIGVNFDKRRGLVIFPGDGEIRSVEDILKFRWLLGPGTLDHVSLADIHSLSRQSGTNLLIHGPFGSRKLKFGDKLKRDECLAEIRRHVRPKILDADFE